MSKAVCIAPTASALSDDERLLELALDVVGGAADLADRRVGGHAHAVERDDARTGG